MLFKKQNSNQLGSTACFVFHPSLATQILTTARD